MTNYLPSRPGKRNVKIYKSNTNNLLYEFKEFEIPPGQIMTFIILDTFPGINVIPILDDINEKIRPDETKARFYNLDGTRLSFTMTSTTSSLSKDLDTGKGTNYTQLSPGQYRLQIRSPNIQSINATLNIKLGRIYTIYIIASMDIHSPGYAQGNIPQVILAVDGNTLFKKCVWE